MADEPAVDPAQQDTHEETGAPQEGHAPRSDETPEIPEGYIPEDRYKNLQADHTRAAQEAAQYRQILEAAQQGDPEALGLLGLDLEADEPETPDEEPFVTREEWEQYQHSIAAQQAQAEQEAEWAQAQQSTIDQIDNGLQAIAQRIGRELTDEEVGFIAPRALATSGEDGSPDVDGAWQAYEALTQQQIKQYIDGKRNAPRVPDGRSATDAPDLSTSEGRLAYGEQRLRELGDEQTLA